MTANRKEQAYQYIRERILAGEFTPGTRLADTELAASMGISRTPVREAIIQLVSQGFVEQVPGQGPTVRGIDRPELEEILEFRELLETAAAAKAAARITAAELAELQGICRRTRALVHAFRDRHCRFTAAQEAELRLLEKAFHLLLMKASRNRRLVQVVNELQVLTHVIERRAEYPPVSPLQRLAQLYRDHSRIVRALATHEPDTARSAVQLHLQWAARYHLGAFDWAQRQTHDADRLHAALPGDVQALLGSLAGRGKTGS